MQIDYYVITCFVFCFYALTTLDAGARKGPEKYTEVFDERETGLLGKVHLGNPTDGLYQRITIVAW